MNESRIPVTPASRAPFSSRRKEMAFLRERFELSRTGEPTVVLLSGDAGIGKTRLIQEALTRAASDGFQTCYGRFIEGGSIPFLPFISGLLPQLKLAGLAPAAAPGEASPREFEGRQVPAPGGAAPFLVEMSRQTVALARRRPLVVAIDDIHWATVAEAEAISHLVLAVADAARSGAAPISVVLGTRPPEPDSPVEAMVGRLQREPIVWPMELRGLDDAEAEAFIRDSLGEPASRRFAAALKSSTRGNPLFLSEALSDLAERDALVRRRGGIESRIDPTELSLPREVTAAVAERVATLEPELLRLLSIAALAGDDFVPSRMAVVAERDEELVGDLLERAIEGRFVTESGGSYSFVHPVIRHVFATQGTAVRRRRTHMWIARSLAAEGADPASIASHLLSAGEAADPLEAGQAAHLAARQALGLHSWAEAGRYFEAALAIPAYVATLAPGEHCKVTHDAAFAHYRNMDVVLSSDRFLEAVVQAKALRDIETWSAALVGWIRAQVAHGGIQPGKMLDSAELQEFLDHCAGHELARARVEVEWSEALWTARDPGALDLATDALEVGRRHSDDLLCTHALVARGLALLQLLRTEEALEAFRESLNYADRLPDPWYWGWALQNLPSSLLMLGRLEEADAACREALEHGRTTHDWAVSATALGYRTVVAVLRGDHTLAEESASECSVMVARSDYAWAAPPMLAALAWSRALRGDMAGAEDAATAFEGAVGRFNAWTPLHLIRQMAGAAPTTSDQVAAEGRYALWSAPADSFTAGLLAARVELARYSGLPELATSAGEALRRGPEGMRFSVFPPFAIRRVVGLAALVAGDADEALTELRRALGEAEKNGARIEAVLALGDLAEASWANGLETEAAEFIERGHHEATLLGLAFVAERYRALAHSRGLELASLNQPGAYPDGLTEVELDILTGVSKGQDLPTIAATLLLSERTVSLRLASAMAKTGVRGAGATGSYLLAHGLIAEKLAGSESIATEVHAAGLQVLMFSDIVNSTPLNRILGDERYVELLSRHDTITERAVARQNGRIIKNMGDGAFAAFPSARGAVEAALELGRAFPIALESAPDALMQIRAGLHAGEPMARSEDLFGLSVTLAKRICDRAPDGGLLVSESVRELCDGAGFSFHEQGRFMLKGIGRRVRLFEVATTNP